MYGTLPPWSKVTWQVSQFASPVSSVSVCGCTEFATTLPSYGALGLKMFQGISFPCTTRTPFFFTAAARHATAAPPDGAAGATKAQWAPHAAAEAAKSVGAVRGMLSREDGRWRAAAEN